MLSRLLVFTWPYALAFWSVYAWAFAPEFRIFSRRQEPFASPQDASSKRLIGLGQGLAMVAAFIIAARVPSGALPHPLRWFCAGLIAIVGGSLLRRHCWRMLGANFTGAVIVNPGQAVIDRGAYHYVRHPSYTAGAILFLGIGLALGNWIGVTVLLAAIAIVYGYRVVVEERALVATIGDPYRRYMDRTKRFVPFLFALAILGAAPRLRADTYPRQRGIDARHYDVRVTLLTSESNEIQAEAIVTLRVVAAGTREAMLDLTSATPDGKGMIVTGVTSNNRAVEFVHRDNRLHLPLPAGVAVDQDVVYTIAYHGVPGNGLRLLNNIHGERTAFSENWYHNARQWLPMIDHPADKATGELTVTTKAEYQVVSNGAIVEQVDLPGGLRRTHWKQDVPISSWLYSLGVAHFIVRQGGVVRGVPLSFWAFPQDADKGLTALARDARESFEFFSDRIGPYPYAKLAHVEAAGMGGGTEHVSNIFYGEKSITAGNAPVVHETAHQWFGDSVTESDWNDVWLSEGFATYFTLLYTEHAAGRDAFVDGLRRSRTAVLRLEKSLPDTPVVHANLNEAATEPNNRLVYEKGAWTLHMLRDAIGTDAFWRGIRLYYQRHMNGLASTTDLRRAMEDVSGQELRWFFDQWLTRSGVPQVAGSWRYDAGAKQIVVNVQQTQPGGPYRFALGVGVTSTAGAAPAVRQVQVSARESTFTIPSDSEPASVVLDPSVWLLAEFGPFQHSAVR